MSGILAVLIANLIWGAAPPIFKYALEGIPPFTLAFIRFFGAGLIFLPFALRQSLKLKNRDLKHIFFGAFWGISINVSFFFLGLKLAPSINVHIISAIGPVLLYFLSLRILKEKSHPQILKGMMVAIVGVCIIVFAPLFRDGGIEKLTSDYSVWSIIVGNLFFIIAMFGGVMMAVSNRQVVQTVSPLVVTCLQFLFGGMLFAPLMIHELPTFSFQTLTFQGWVGIIYGTLFSSALAYYCLAFALSKLPAQKTAIFTYLLPVIAVLVAMPLLGEYPDIFYIVGAIFIFIGIVVSERHPHYHAVKKKVHSLKS